MLRLFTFTKEIMLILQNISYQHSNKELLFEHLQLTVNKYEKMALVGNNGAGKSTLLKIITGELQPSSGHISMDSDVYYVPQIFGQYNHLTVAEALGIDAKLLAFREILDGNATEENLNTLNDDWSIEERCAEALSHWQLDDVDLFQKLDLLSGGQKTKIFLAGIFIHKPGLVLLDEPSNHLDAETRSLLYDFIQTARCTVLVVSHDRKLLNLVDNIAELSSHGIRTYGGNYDFYATQKQVEIEALANELKNSSKALRKAKEKERETAERQQKLDARGKRKQENAGVAKIMMNTMRNKAENSTAKLKNVHHEKIDGISSKIRDLRSVLPDIDQMKMDFSSSQLPKGKVILRAESLNFAYNDRSLWEEPLNFELTSGERVALRGANGSGKTTLINVIMGRLKPTRGSIFRTELKAVYVDQEYSLINNRLSCYEQAQEYNTSALLDHEVKTRLNRFLFTSADWEKPCGALSGGEKMRLLLCCLTLSEQSPDLLILDEPTNNLDLQNMEILTAAIREYQGTLLIVSHDEQFLEEIGVGRVVHL